jgi:IS30 family transposase
MRQAKHSTSRGQWKQLSEKERYKIEALSRAKHNVWEIAGQLGRDRRTIEREIRRGTEPYTAPTPDRGTRRKTPKLAIYSKSKIIVKNLELSFGICYSPSLPLQRQKTKTQLSSFSVVEQ